MILLVMTSIFQMLLFIRRVI